MIELAIVAAAISAPLTAYIVAKMRRRACQHQWRELHREKGWQEPQGAFVPMVTNPLVGDSAVTIITYFCDNCRRMSQIRETGWLPGSVGYSWSGREPGSRRPKDAQ